MCKVFESNSKECKSCHFYTLCKKYEDFINECD